MYYIERVNTVNMPICDIIYKLYRFMMLVHMLHSLWYRPVFTYAVCMNLLLCKCVVSKNIFMYLLWSIFKMLSLKLYDVKFHSLYNHLESWNICIDMYSQNHFIAFGFFFIYFFFVYYLCCVFVLKNIRQSLLSIPIYLFTTW